MHPKLYAHQTAPYPLDLDFRPGKMNSTRLSGSPAVALNIDLTCLEDQSSMPYRKYCKSPSIWSSFYALPHILQIISHWIRPDTCRDPRISRLHYFQGHPSQLCARETICLSDSSGEQLCRNQPDAWHKYLHGQWKPRVI